MYEYAIQEFHSLLNTATLPGNGIDERTPAFRYLCALVAELAYYYVPKWEIDAIRMKPGTSASKLQMIGIAT